MSLNGIVATLVSVVPIVGWIAGAVIVTVVYVSVVRVYGIGYRNVVGASAVK